MGFLGTRGTGEQGNKEQGEQRTRDSELRILNSELRIFEFRIPVREHANVPELGAVFRRFVRNTFAACVRLLRSRYIALPIRCYKRRTPNGICFRSHKIAKSILYPPYPWARAPSFCRFVPMGARASSLRPSVPPSFRLSVPPSFRPFVLPSPWGRALRRSVAFSVPLFFNLNLAVLKSIPSFFQLTIFH